MEVLTKSMNQVENLKNFDKINLKYKDLPHNKREHLNILYVWNRCLLHQSYKTEIDWLDSEIVNFDTLNIFYKKMGYKPLQELNDTYSRNGDGDNNNSAYNLQTTYLKDYTNNSDDIIPVIWKMVVYLISTTRLIAMTIPTILLTKISMI